MRMNTKVEVTTLAISKLKNEQSHFVKYDIEAALDEVENTDTEVKLKYKFVLLSNPTNTKINVEGFAIIYTDQSELSKYLGLDEKKIPNIVNIIYQEIFPLFYILSKSMQIPCPAYKLSEVSALSKETSKPMFEEKNNSVELIQEINDFNESQTSSETHKEITQSINPETIQEPVIQSSV
jgi:hypothetical protein